MQSALQQHLSHLIAVRPSTVENIDATLQVTVRYVVLADGVAQQATLRRAGGAAHEVLLLRPAPARSHQAARAPRTRIEFLEVRDHLEPVQALRQRTLFVRLLRPGFALTPDNVLIDGGERLPIVPVEWVAAADNLPPGTDPALVDGIDDLPRTLVVRTTAFGDFSRYTLHLRASSGSDQPPGGFDPRLSSIEFSFKVECPSDFDCADTTPCPPERLAKPRHRLPGEGLHRASGA